MANDKSENGFTPPADVDPESYFVKSVSSGDVRIDRFAPAEQRKIMRKIDWRLLLTPIILLDFSVMTRTNTGLANIAGMSTDLNLHGYRYNEIVLFFFITWIGLQPLAVLVMRKVGPSTFLPTITLLWGAVAIGSGFVKHWAVMIPLRLLLGGLQAGFFTGSIYLLSAWYPRYELHKRVAALYLLSGILSSFDGIISYAFSRMGGLGSGAGLGQHVRGPNGTFIEKSGIAGWRWIFIMEGTLTCFFALLAYPFIIDFPEKAHRKSRFHFNFLSEDEAAFAMAKVEKDRNDVLPGKFNLTQYLQNAFDLKIWAFAMLYLLVDLSTYAMVYYLPNILSQGLHMDLAASLCLTSPPYFASAIVGLACAWAGDKWHIRSPFIIGNGLLGILGLSLLGFAKSNGARYFGALLGIVASNANIPTIIAWQQNNIRGQWRRACSSAILVASGGIGGIIGTTIFRTQDAPHYYPGISACLAASGLLVLISCIMVVQFHRANKRAAAGGKLIENLEGFRYTL